MLTDADALAVVDRMLGRFDACKSPDGLYRWALTRPLPGQLGEAARVLVWVMHNPSVADERRNDLTIAKVGGFTMRLGCSGILVGNRYGRISTFPTDLLALYPSSDSIGDENDTYLRAIFRVAARAALPQHRIVIAAWGDTPGPVPGRDRMIAELAAGAGVTLMAFGTTKRGQPRHPSRLPYSAIEAFAPWSPP